MKKLWLCVLMMCANVVSAQTAPVRSEDVVASANILSNEKRIAFQVRWTQRAQVDSTMIAVFLSNDTLPVVYRRAMSPDTVIFTIPDDTTTYKFLLVNVRRGLSSAPANVNFYFNADNYYQMTRILIRPDSVVVVDTTTVGRTVQFCAFFEMNDGSILMRNKDRSIIQCVIEYEKFDNALRKSWGARLRKINDMCLEWSAPNGGTIVGEDCSKP